MTPTPTYASPCGRLVLYHGDNLDILPGLAPASVDAVITDPPYGISDGERIGVFDADGAVGAMDHEWDREVPLDWIVPCSRAMADGAAWIVWTSREGTSLISQQMVKHSIRHLCSLYWNRTQASMNPRKNFGNSVEQAVFARSRGAVLCWRGGNHRDNLIRCPKVVGDQREHPTQKPVRVMEWCIDPVTDTDHIVLDPFMGSGTTGVAALRMGRKFIGIERDPEYFAAAAARLHAELNQGKLF